MTTNLRLLLDEAVTDPLAELISRLSSAINVECVRNLPIKGADDGAVIQYARDHSRIVVTTETGINHISFPVCTTPGIIVLTGGSRHESIHAGILQRFLLSGRRKEAKDAVTFLGENEVRIRNHEGNLKFKLGKGKSKRSRR